MKFKFKQEEILKAMMTADTDVAKLADVAGVAANTVQNALKGKSVTMQTYFKLRAEYCTGLSKGDVLID